MHASRSCRTPCAGMVAIAFAFGLGFASSVLADLASDLAALKQRYEDAAGSYPQKFAAVQPAFEAFVRDHPGTEEALEAQLFLFRETWWEREKGTMTQTADALADKILAAYPKSPQLAKLVEYQYVLSSDKRRQVFETLLADSPHDIVKAEALLGLGKLGIRSGDEAVRGKAERRLTELSERFGKLLRRGQAPYAELADAMLKPHAAAALKVGQPAPEIVGRDLDGKPMRLSDFHGKVVLLDFWGDW